MSLYAELLLGPIQIPCKENEGRNYEKEKEVGALQKKDWKEGTRDPVVT